MEEAAHGICGKSTEKIERSVTKKAALKRSENVNSLEIAIKVKP